MIKVRNKPAYDELKANPEATLDEAWEILMKHVSMHDVPILAGGLDHVRETKNGFIFQDRCVNASGTWHDNSFIITK